MVEARWERDSPPERTTVSKPSSKSPRLEDRPPEFDSPRTPSYSGPSWLETNGLVIALKVTQIIAIGLFVLRARVVLACFRQALFRALAPATRRRRIPAGGICGRLAGF